MRDDDGLGRFAGLNGYGVCVDQFISANVTHNGGDEFELEMYRRP